MNLYLFEVNWERGGGYFLPYSTGSLWAFAKQNPTIDQNYQLIDFVFQRAPIAELITNINDPDVCAFSSYVWNLEYNLEVSKTIKQKWPNCHIVFGGPAVDDVPMNFLTRHSWVDTVCNGEGELMFSEFLIDHLAKSAKSSYKGERIKDLHLPSPYLTGVFDNIIQKHPEFNWSMPVETNRGCPFACTFCDWGSNTQSKVNRFDLAKIFDEIEWAGKNQIDFLYIADANFGIFYERDLEIAQYLVDTKKKYGYPLLMEANYYKNSTKKMLDIIKVLEDGGLISGLTLSVQSQSDRVLEAVKRRNMEISNLSAIVKECQQRSIPYYTEFILPLPEETLESWCEGLCNIIEGGFKETIVVFPTEVLVNSELARQRDQYNLEIEIYSGMREGDASGIKEKHRYVMSTNTMSRSELVHAWYYAHMIAVFHGWGWTQAVADFVRLYQQRSYRSIYDSLLHYLANNVYFAQDFDAYKSTLEIKSESNRIKLDLHLPTRNVRLHLNRKQTFQQLEPWFQDVLKDCPSELAQSLLQYQQQLPVHIDHPNGYTFKCDYNIQEYLQDQAVLTKQATTYQTVPRSHWISESEFQKFILLRLYQGFPKNKIIKLP